VAHLEKLEITCATWLFNSLQATKTGGANGSIRLGSISSFSRPSSSVRFSFEGGKCSAEDNLTSNKFLELVAPSFDTYFFK
jgi:hypothetical protein